MAKISIIIRCYNEEAHIGRLLSGIMLQTQKDLEIIVVDSGSTDATVKIASQFPTSIVYIDKEDFSFGRSLNLGCSAATGEILIFASAHVYPLYDNWLEDLVVPFEDEKVACSYGRQCGNSKTKFSEHMVFAQWFPMVSEKTQDHPFCNNANAAVRRSAWEAYPYDETLTGLEDLAWAKNIIVQGHKIAYRSEAAVVHVHEESYPQVLNRYRREAIAMKAIFPHESFSKIRFLHLFSKNALNDMVQAFKQGKGFNNLTSIIAFRAMQFWGTHRGYTQHGKVSRTLREKFYYPNQTGKNVGQSSDLDKQKRLIDYSSHD